jgi:DNA-binding beta-propeller fold protein YncE
MKTLNRLVAGCLIVLLSIGTTCAQAQKSGYRLADKVKIGGEGGWDYLAVDTAMHRLFISRGTHVQVFDMEKKVVVGDIPSTIGVHGIALAQEFGKGFTSNGRDSSVTVFDLKTLKVLKTVKIPARNPDAILYDPHSRRIFTFNGGSANTTAIDAQTDSVIGNLALDGRPEFGVADSRGKIFVNLEDKSTVVAFESKTMKVVARWPLSPGEEPTGLALDEEHNRLFAGCGNKLMVVLDATTGKTITSLPIGEGVDATAYDPDTHLAFSSNGEGTVTVIQENGGKYAVLENIATQKGSRTMTLDPKTHRIYLSGALFGPPPAPTPDRPRPRPVIEPGSFTILILER